MHPPRYFKFLVAGQLASLQYRMRAEWPGRWNALHQACVLQINQYMYIDKMINTSAFTYFSQIRVVNEETAYISPTNGEHCVPLLAREGAPDRCAVKGVASAADRCVLQVASQCQTASTRVLSCIRVHIQRLRCISNPF